MISLFSCFLGSQPTSDKSSQRPSESTNCSPARKRSSSESTSSPGTCCSFEETRLSLVNRRTRGSHRPRRGAGVDVDAQHSAAGQGRAEHRGGGGAARSEAMRASALRPCMSSQRTPATPGRTGPCPHTRPGSCCPPTHAAPSPSSLSPRHPTAPAFPV